MKDLEQSLTRAFTRVDAPAGFAGRVLAEARARRNRRRVWLAAASLVAMLLPTGYAYHRHAESQRMEGLQREAELRLALEIASEKLNLALKHLNSNPE